MTHRVAVLDKELCQPKKWARMYQILSANKQGQIVLFSMKIPIRQQLMKMFVMAAGICVKVCPFDANNLIWQVNSKQTKFTSME